MVCILEKKFQGAAYSRSCPCRNAPVATMRKNYTAKRYYYIVILNVNHRNKKITPRLIGVCGSITN